MNDNMNTHTDTSTPPATPQTLSPTPPGWYPDPYDESHQRWWDGAEWTAQVYPPAPAPTMTVDGGPQMTTPPGTTIETTTEKEVDKNPAAKQALSTALYAAGSLVVSWFLLWWLFLSVATLGAVAAMVQGFSAIRTARETGVGYGRAVAGVAVGAVVLVVSILLWIMMFSV